MERPARLFYLPGLMFAIGRIPFKYNYHSSMRESFSERSIRKGAE